MTKLNFLSAYFPLIAALTSMLAAQIIKMIYNIFIYDNLKLQTIFESGGMPSSHSALVGSLTAAIGLQEGFMSPLFSICVVFSAIVLYDAAGVRRAVGEQAHILNQIIDDLFEKGSFHPNQLSEILGHTPLEVVFGVLLGIAIASSFWVIL
jgi:uncharacterized protein